MILFWAIAALADRWEANPMPHPPFRGRHAVWAWLSEPEHALGTAMLGLLLVGLLTQGMRRCGGRTRRMAPYVAFGAPPLCCPVYSIAASSLFAFSFTAYTAALIHLFISILNHSLTMCDLLC